jgi:hypothetical protein
LQHPHPPSGARFRLLLLVLFALLAAAPAAAQEAPRFLIEKITVAGNRRPASARIVVSESLLKEGQTYGEDELRTAIHRIKRLPFVIDADFALKKGSERGRYELVVTVEETRPLFADIEVQGDLAERPVIPNLPQASRRFDFSNNAALGVREFLGSEGLVFASIGSSNGLVQVGYTRYDLFGRGSFASFALAYDPENRAFTPSLSAGVPLTVNQSLRATASWLKSSFRSGGVREELTQRSGQLDWLYNTTDDPLFPTRGDELEANLAYGRFDSVAKFTDTGLATLRFDERTWGFSLSGRHHRPLTARQSLSFSFAASALQFADDDPTPNSLSGTHGYQASVGVEHALDLLLGERAHRWGDLRLETSASYGGSYSGTASVFGLDDHPAYQLTLGEKLVFRNPWAIVRLGVSYRGKVMR